MVLIPVVMPYHHGYERFFSGSRRVTVYSRARAYYDCRRSPIQPAYIVEKLNEPVKARVLVIDEEESSRYAVGAGLDFLDDYDVHFLEYGLKGIGGLKELRKGNHK